jgi:hypothetical protein
MRAGTPGVLRWDSRGMACPDVSPFPTSIVMSAAISSALRAAAEKDVAREKQTTVPLSAVARTAGEHRGEGAGDEIAVPTAGTCGKAGHLASRRGPRRW